MEVYDLTSSPSILVDGVRYSISVARTEHEDDKKNHSLAQRRDDGSWAIGKYQSSDRKSPERNPYMCLLFKGLGGDMEYIYNLRSPQTGNKLTTSYCIDLMKQTMFHDPSRNDTAIWKSFQLIDGYEGSVGSFAKLITTARGAYTHRLFIFRLSCLERGGRFINVEHVRLKKDVYLDSKDYNPVYHLNKCFRIPVRLKHNGEPRLKVVTIGNDQVLLSWEDGPKWYGLVAKIADDGYLPEPSQWRKVEMNFKHGLEMSKNGIETPFEAVVVPDEYD